jgi:hypothetical protein
MSKVHTKVFNQLVEDIRSANEVLNDAYEKVTDDEISGHFSLH